MTEKKIRDWIHNTSWINVLALLILFCSIYGFVVFWRDITSEFNLNSSQIIGSINSFCIGCAGASIFLLVTKVTKGGVDIVKDSHSMLEHFFNLIIILIGNFLFIFILVIYFKGSWINSALEFIGCEYQFNIQNSLVNTNKNKILLVIGGIAGVLANEYYHLLFGSKSFWVKIIQMLTKPKSLS